MRKWLVLVGLAAAVVVVMLALRSRGPSAEAPVSPPPGAPVQQPTPPAAEAAPSPQKPDRDPEPGAMGGHGGSVDEGTRAILTYQLTMKKLEAYIAALHEIRRAGERDGVLLAKLQRPGQAGDTPAAVAARLEAIPQVEAILKRHAVTALDLVLIPRVVTLGQNAYALEQEGRPLPADQQNTSATALYRADLPRMDALAKEFRADLIYLRDAGRPPVR